MNAVRAGGRWHWMGWAFVAVAGLAFVARGPARAVSWGHRSNDLAPSYAASTAWARGENPYDQQLLRSILGASGRELDAHGDPEVSTALYPPPTYLLLSPLSLLSWPGARIVFLAVNLVLFGFHLRALLQLGRLNATSSAGLFLVGCVFALSPYHTGIALGQLAIPSISLLVIAIHLVSEDRQNAGGIALAFSTILKPQIAAPFIVYYLIRGKTRVFWIACATCALATCIGIGWLSLHDIPWTGRWLANNRLEIVGGGIDPEGATNFHMVDARLILSALGAEFPTAIALLVGGGVALFVYRMLPRDDDHELLVVGTLACCVLIAVYHRFYDAAVLSLPLAWAIGAAWRDRRARATAVVVIACCAVFFIPGQVALARFAEWRQFPTAIAHSAFWESVLLKHQAWVLLILQVALLRALWIQGNSTNERLAAGNP